MGELSDRIRQARLAAGFATATEAAGRLGMKPHAYRHYESGYRMPPTSRLADIAKLFKVDMEWLVTGKGGAQDDSAEVYDLWEHIDKRDRPAALQMLRGLARKDNSSS